MNYLAACDIFFRQESHIVSGKNSKVLGEVVESLLKHDLFAAERKVIAELGGVKITNEMLEDW